jgi:opacity protein-like surface antigen
MPSGAATEGSKSMRQNSACQALIPTLLAQTLLGGLAAVAVVATALPARAGDLSNRGAGGIKDYGGAAVPVPAPMAYEENFKWYVRGDIGTGFKHSGNIGVEGLPASVLQPKDWHELSILSVGFGRYLTPSIRAEMTLDYRTPRTLASGTKTLPDITRSARSADGTATIGGNSVPVINIQTNIYSGIQNDNQQYQNSTFLMSAFYDFNREGRLKPYVGAGIGLARHELHREGRITYTCYDGFQVSTPVGFGSQAPVTTGCTVLTAPTPLATSYVSDTSKTATGWGLATQISAGLTYSLTPRTHWDTGYRMLWQSGRVAVASSDGASVIRINDRFDHEVRTGIRWDLW